MRRSTALSLLLLPLLPLPAPAADPPPSEVFSESIDVDVVNVDVFVADRSGHPVHGLGRDDFELRVDGKPVAITNFYAAEGETAGTGEAPEAGLATQGAAARAAVPAAAARPLTLVLFVDDMNLSEHGRNPTLQHLSRTLRDGLGRRDRVLIAVWSEKGLKLYAPAAGDGAAAAKALDEIASLPAHGTVDTNEWTKAMQDLANAVPRGATNPELDEVEARLNVLAERREGEAHRMLLTLTSLIDGLGGIAGRKSLLYMSGSLAVPSGDGAVRDLAEHANAAGVTLYGLGAQDDYASILLGATKLTNLLSPSSLAHARGDDLARTLQEIVGPTGGVAAVDLNRPGFLLDRMREDASSYYSLGFAPAPEASEPAPGAPRPHRLEVRVKGRGGLDVRFPATYAARSRDERLAERARSALLLDADARESAPANPLGVRLGFERDELASYGRRAVTVLVTLPLARLTLAPAPAPPRAPAAAPAGSAAPAASAAPPAGEAVREGRVEMFVAARDSTGHELRMRRIAFPVRVPRLPEAEAAVVAAKSVAYRLRLELPPGESVLALGVRDAVGGGESTVAARYVAGASAGLAPSPERHPK